MDPEEFRELLRGMLNEYSDRMEEGAEPNPDDVVPDSVQSYKEYGILTHDNGLVVSLDDGTRFTVTIKRYRY